MSKRVKNLFFILCLLFVNLALGQVVVKGKVMSEQGEPLAYVNIGIKDKNVGAISDEQGYFSITIDASKVNEALTFSHIGFCEKTFKISELTQEPSLVVVLQEKINQLEEVVVVPSKSELVQIGTTSYSSMVYVRYIRGDEKSSDNASSQSSDLPDNIDSGEIAKKIKIGKPSLLVDVNVNLFDIDIDTATFRINVYDIKNNLPNQRINAENIIITQTLKNGWNKFDIEKYNLRYDKPIFITIEYLPKKDETSKSLFKYRGKFFGKFITRYHSLGAWDVKKGLTVAMYVTVKQ